MQARPASLDSIAISDDAGQVPIYSRKKAMRYPGGKGGAGVYQTIINNIPPHDTYIETHLGGGNILERKRPAARSVGIDVDPEVIEVCHFQKATARNVRSQLHRLSGLIFPCALDVQNGVKQRQWVACIGCVDRARSWVIGHHDERV